MATLLCFLAAAGLGFLAITCDAIGLPDPCTWVLVGLGVYSVLAGIFFFWLEERGR